MSLVSFGVQRVLGESPELEVLEVALGVPGTRTAATVELLPLPGPVSTWASPSASSALAYISEGKGTPKILGGDPKNLFEHPKNNPGPLKPSQDPPEVHPRSWKVH